MPEPVPSSSDHSGMRGLLCAAALVVVVAGLKQADTLLVPVIVALFLSLLCIPPMRWLEDRGVPIGLAILIVMVVASVLVLSVTAVVGNSVAEFQSQLPYYRDRLDLAMAESIDSLRGLGLDVQAKDLSDNLDTSSIMTLVAATASGMLSVMSNVFLIVLTMIFMLLEAAGFRRKLAVALGRSPNDKVSEWAEVSVQVQKYLAIKAWVSLATGLCVTALCFAVGVDFAILWGLVAFLFNFVPNIGSIIAAIPACLLSLLQLGPGPTMVLAIGYVTINTVIGNFIEPRWMGRRLGLSTLVVFLSLLFWGWVWGPVGMLLSVPLTVILKIMLEHSDDFRWIAVLLGPNDEEIPPLPRPAVAVSLDPDDDD